MPTPWWAGHDGLVGIVCEHFVRDVSEYYRTVSPAVKDCYLNKSKINEPGRRQSICKWLDNMTLWP